MFIISYLGTFKVPLSGTWSVTFSFFADNGRDNTNLIYLYKNMNKIWESEHRTLITADGYVHTTGGRTMFLSLRRGDIVHLHSEKIDQGIHRVLICYEFKSDIRDNK